MADLTITLRTVSDAQRSQPGGSFQKVKHITYTVGSFGPFQEDVPDGPNWNAEAQRLMQAQAHNLRTLGV